MTTSRAHFLRSPKVLLPALAVLLGGLLSADLTTSNNASAQAAAAGSCTLVVPAKVTINTQMLTPTHTLGNDCAAAGVIEAKWQASTTSGTVLNKSYFNFNYPIPWVLFDNAPLGTWLWQQGGARGRDLSLKASGDRSPKSSDEMSQADVEVSQNRPVTDIRLATLGQLASWSFQPGCNTTFNAWTTRYAAAWDGYVANAGATGSLQMRPPDHSTIANVRNFTADAAGNYTVTVPTSGPNGEWRIWINDSMYTWASSSAWKPVNDPC